MKKRLLTAAVLASTLGLGLLTSASLANGPIIMGPVSAPMPKVGMNTAMSTANMQMAAVSTYRQVRAFWLSRALVR
jgi:hypothetical protein